MKKWRKPVVIEVRKEELERCIQAAARSVGCTKGNFR